MSSKVSVLCILALLFFSFTVLSPPCAARPEPSFSDVTPLNNTDQTENVEAVKVEEKCEGVGEEECLMRRTLAAHVDYIYTQNSKP